MKKFIFFFVCGIFCAIAGYAQDYQVGEAFVKDGIPCIVISVDGTGKHGIAMSLKPTDKAVKYAKKAKDDTWFYFNNKLKGEDFKQRTEYRKEFYELYANDTTRVSAVGTQTKVTPSTSRSGKDNMRNIIAFCSEKSIDMDKFFHPEAWALKLGDDWFIPGVDELEMFAQMFGFNSFSVKNSEKPGDITKRQKEISQIFTQTLAAMSEEDAECFKDVALVTPLTSVYSSTMIISMKYAANIYCTPKVERVMKIPVRQWYDLYSTSIILERGHVYAVCEF